MCEFVKQLSSGGGGSVANYYLVHHSTAYCVGLWLQTTLGTFIIITIKRIMHRLHETISITSCSALHPVGYLIYNLLPGQRLYVNASDINIVAETEDSDVLF